ncbi:hypothetical protein KAH37_05470 [bacterium]|nr:hypothetical protein [bacterium]
MKFSLLLLVLFLNPLFAEETPASPVAIQKEEKKEAVPQVQTALPPKKSALTKEQKTLCERDKHRVTYKLDELTTGEKTLFIERIRQEEAICKESEKCRCDIYPFMLGEIEKRVALRPTAAPPIARSYNENDDEVPLHKRSKDDLLSEASALEYQGHQYKKIGVPLLTVGTTLTLYSLIVSAVSFSQYAQCQRDNSSSSNYNDCSYHYASSGMGLSSMITFILGVPALVTGAIFTAKGNKRLAEAQELKRAAKFAFSFAPIIDPKKKLYGASLSLKF